MRIESVLAILISLAALKLSANDPYLWLNLILSAVIILWVLVVRHSRPASLMALGLSVIQIDLHSLASVRASFLDYLVHAVVLSTIMFILWRTGKGADIRRED
ncbi:MAG: hypothetical protein EOP84_27585 [Verrucomicrobiaceae bacterium]|nr:MAG: hypothetical protein EOP84_27585 [Verrucomicrobiaceae bacterium]